LEIGLREFFCQGWIIRFSTRVVCQWEEQAMDRIRVLLPVVLMLLIGLPVASQEDAPAKNKNTNQNRVGQRQQRQYPPQIDDAEAEVYKTVGDVKLNAWIFQPKNDNANVKRPAAVFFFGGGWRSGSPTQFVPHCRHLAEQGMIGIVVDYRVSSRHNVKMTACVADAKSAIRWVRENSQRLGIDPDRIVAGGGSAGGHLAAATALLTDFAEPSENQDVSCKPNALLLFNPALVLAPVEGHDEFFDPAKVERFKQTSGTDPVKVSPYHGIASNEPPTIIFHGKADTTVPYATAALFAEQMQKKGNRCELVGYEGQGHGFFNANRKGDEYYKKTVAEMDKFLRSLGYLTAEQTTTGAVEKTVK
jgi:acetyl esterase/lipase